MTSLLMLRASILPVQSQIAVVLELAMCRVDAKGQLCERQQDSKALVIMYTIWDQSTKK